MIQLKQMSGYDMKNRSKFIFLYSQPVVPTLFTEKISIPIIMF